MDVIVGTMTTGRENVVGPALPAVLVTVTAIEVVAAAVGVPVTRPLAEMLAHPGSPVADQLSGGLVPVN